MVHPVPLGVFVELSFFSRGSGFWGTVEDKKVKGSLYVWITVRVFSMFWYNGFIPLVTFGLNYWSHSQGNRCASRESNGG